MVGFKRGQNSKTSLDVGYSIWLKDAWDNIDVHKGRAFIRMFYPNARTSRANFEDGYKCAVVCDGILESAREGKRKVLEY